MGDTGSYTIFEDQGLGLEMASRRPRVTFFWIEKGRSWLVLWPTEQALIPYHPSLRHDAFYVELEDMRRAQQWLRERGIAARCDFGVAGEDQPLVLESDAGDHPQFSSMTPTETPWS